MKKKKDIVDEAVNALKRESVPAGPPHETADAVVAKLGEAGGVPPPRTVRERIKAVGFAKMAAAAVLLIVAGYAVGRLTAPRPPDLEQLHYALETSLKSSLEPVLRQELAEQMNQRWQLALAGSYVRLREELARQLHSDMNEFGVQILAASGAVTNRRLTDLTEAISAALEQIELNRLHDRTRLRNDFATFAAVTGDELLRTKQDVAEWIAYCSPDDLILDESKNSTPNERSKK